MTGGPPTVARTTPLPSTGTRQVANGDVTANLDISERLLDVLADLVAEHGTLYAWAATQPQPRALRGRAPVYVAELPERLETVVVRHAWHGGLLAPVTGDRFRRPSRAPVELNQSARLLDIGIPTTTVLGFARYDAGPGLCRVDVVTRFVPDAFDLGQVVAGLVPGLSATEALNATQLLLERLAHGRVVHPDLNVKNVLLTRSTTGVSAMVIDVDVVSITPDASFADTMQRNVQRLGRSLRKWRTQFGCDLSERDIARFLADATSRANATSGGARA